MKAEPGISSDMVVIRIITRRFSRLKYQFMRFQMQTLVKSGMKLWWFWDRMMDLKTTFILFTWKLSFIQVKTQFMTTAINLYTVILLNH